MNPPERLEKPLPPTDEVTTSGEAATLLPFFFVLVMLAVLRVFLGYVSVPLRFVAVGTILSTIVFVSAPIFALYYAGRYRWTAKAALIFVAVGLLIHFGIGVGLGHYVLHDKGFFAAICLALGPECGFPMWCVGFGALLASLLKDRNLIIPVSIFLIAFDVFLVLTPIGPTKLMLQHLPQVLPKLGYSVPQVSSAPTKGPVGVLGTIGPADFLFMGMFFVSLFRFGLRARLTVIWLIPAVLIYMLLAVKFQAIPMLVPIGLTVLLVNLTAFKMNKEEKVSTLGVLIIALLIITGSLVLRARQPAPSPAAAGQAAPVPASSPAPASRG